MADVQKVVINDYTGKRMALASGAIEHCDSCTGEITGDYIRVDDVCKTTGVCDCSPYIYCLECGTDDGENCWN